MFEAAHRSILKGHYGKVGAMAAAAPGCEISEIWDIWHEIVARSEGKQLSVQWVRTVRWRSSCGFSGEVGSDEMGFFLLQTGHFLERSAADFSQFSYVFFQSQDQI